MLCVCVPYDELLTCPGCVLCLSREWKNALADPCHTHDLRSELNGLIEVQLTQHLGSTTGLHCIVMEVSIFIHTV